MLILTTSSTVNVAQTNPSATMRLASPRLSKSTSHGKPLEITEAITAFMIMSPGKVSDKDRVPVLAADAQDVSAIKEEADAMTASKISTAEIV